MNNDFQIGDLVYHFHKGDDVIENIKDNIIQLKKSYDLYHIDGTKEYNQRQTLFHREAVRVNDDGNITNIDYNFKIDRSIQIRKISDPYDYCLGDYVLVKEYKNDRWLKRQFERLKTKDEVCDNHKKYFKASSNFWKYCIPFKMNEHLEDKICQVNIGTFPKTEKLPLSKYVQTKEHLTITLVGSTKFKKLFKKINIDLSYAGHSVFTVCLFGHKIGLDMNGHQKRQFDIGYMRKIRHSDAIFVINPNNYIGLGACDEIYYAKALDKKIYSLNYISFKDDENYEEYTELPKNTGKCQT